MASGVTRKTEKQTENREKKVFESESVPKALLSMVIPTIASQVIFVFYNLADTWFVGLTDNAQAVAALSVCLPVYAILSGFANLFGIGGGAIISRAIGRRDIDRAKLSFAVSVWGAVISAVAYALLLLLFARPLLLMIGADASDLDYCMIYIRWTILVAGLPTILGPCLGHLMRATGHAKQASLGMVIGAVVNTILDPIMIFMVMGSENAVAAVSIATMIANYISLTYYVTYTITHREELHASIAVDRDNTPAMAREVFRSGLPGFFLSVLSNLSNCMLNGMLGTLGSEAEAGLGVVRKIDTIAYAVNQGITQGMIPLAAYYYGANRQGKLKQVMLLAGGATEIFSILCALCSMLFAPQLITFFIRDPQTVAWGVKFLRILCLAIPVYSLTLLIIAFFQAVGKGAWPMILSILNKGSLDLVLMIVYRNAFGLQSILWGTPSAQLLALVVALILLVKFFRDQGMSSSPSRTVRHAKVAHAVH